MNPFVPLGTVFLVLLLAFVALILVARTTKWKPTPIRPIWAVAAIVAADFVAGLVCSIYGRDIHILYWWLVGLPIAAVLIPLTIVTTTVCVRLVNAAVFSVIDRCRGRR